METHELTHATGSMGYNAAMRTLTFIGFDMRDSRFSDLGIPAIWTAYLAEFDRLFIQEQLDAKIDEIHTYVATTYATTAVHQELVRLELDRLYAQLAGLVPEASPIAANGKSARRSPGE